VLYLLLCYCFVSKILTFLLQLYDQQPTDHQLCVKMASKSNAEREFVEHMSRWIPKFQDVFDEETFYIFVIVLVVIAIIGAIVMSRFFTIRDAGHID